MDCCFTYHDYKTDPVEAVTVYAGYALCRLHLERVQKYAGQQRAFKRSQSTTGAEYHIPNLMDDAFHQAEVGDAGSGHTC